jgi:hypothetical protein
LLFRGEGVLSKEYAPLIDALVERSINASFQKDDQLVVSTQRGSALPFSGNSFWVTYNGDRWYLCTWGPVCYELPASADCASLCADFVTRGRCAQTFVSRDLVQNYGLRQLEYDEFDRVFSSTDGPR